MDPLNTAASSFDALYRDCARDLYAYVHTLLGDDASAEDVTALAFERAYRRRESFDERRGSRRGWLFGIARNAALDELAPRDRELVALKFHGGLSNAELATLLGTSETNAGTRVHRAVTKLRKACHAPA